MSGTVICPICYFNLANEVVVALQCGHCFHQNCLLRAFQLTVIPDGGDPFMRYCPICRSEVSFVDQNTCPGLILRFSRSIDDNENIPREVEDGNARSRSRGEEEDDDFLGWLNSLGYEYKQRTSRMPLHRHAPDSSSSDEGEAFHGF